jgi:hypothetical protein
MGKPRNAYKILVGKPQPKRPLRRPRHRLEDNIRRILAPTASISVVAGNSLAGIEPFGK